MGVGFSEFSTVAIDGLIELFFFPGSRPKNLDFFGAGLGSQMRHALAMKALLSPVAAFTEKTVFTTAAADQNTLNGFFAGYIVGKRWWQ
jgi:hypothetical protein